MYKVEYNAEVRDDISNIPLEVLSEVREYFIKYETEPYKYSQKLSNKFAFPIANSEIIIKIENDITKIVEVIAVGERKDKLVYKVAHERVNKT